MDKNRYLSLALFLILITASSFSVFASDTDTPATDAAIAETEVPETQVSETEVPETQATETEALETENVYAQAQELGRQELVELYSKVKNNEIEIIDQDPAYGPLVVVAQFDWKEDDAPDISWHTPTPENYMGLLPKDRLANTYEEAQTAILIYPVHFKVGFYTIGGDAYETTTKIAVVDLDQMKMYNVNDFATTNPPQTVYGPIGTSGYGPMKVEEALEYIAAELNSQQPEDYAPAEDSGISETDTTETEMIPPDQILDAFGNDVFRTTYDALSQGEEISNGTKSDTAKGLQDTLNEFGRGLTTDGAAGNLTFEALHQVQEALGLEVTETVSQDTYLQLLKYLLLDTDESLAASALGSTDSSEAAYQHAKVLKLKGQGYLAKQKFEESQWDDWEAQAAECVQAWPENGKIAQNPTIQGSEVELVIERNGTEGTAMQVDICTMEGEVVQSLFIQNSGQAAAYLPSGTYVIKSTGGSDWYGPADAFGEDHSWSVMTFDSDEDPSQKVPYVNLPAGSWIITINTSDYDPTAESVGSMSMEDYLAWSSQNT